MSNGNEKAIQLLKDAKAKNDLAHERICEAITKNEESKTEIEAANGDIDAAITALGG